MSKPIIEVRGLTYRYGDYRAVDHVDLAVMPGQIYGLLGTNGAGKTTTLELLQGFRAADSGEVRVHHVDPRRDSATIRANTGVVLQEAGHYPELSVVDTVKMWAGLSSRADDVGAVIEAVGLSHRAHHVIATLSGGERRRLDLALAIWGTPDLVILDEPTTGLDPESRHTLWSVVRRMRDHGTTVVLTTHYLEEAEQLADTVAIMHRGRIATAGTIDQVVSTHPARIVVDIDTDRLPPGWPGTPPDGIDLDFADCRPTGHGTTAKLTVTSRDQQGALGWLLHAADRDGVRLGPLRATPASLEEVFLHIAGRPTATAPTEREERPA